MSSIGHKIGSGLRKFIIKTNLSRWLLIFSIMLTAVMMHPSIAALITLIVNLCVLLLMRRSAMIESLARARQAKG